jgi:hypothetical protein
MVEDTNILAFIPGEFISKAGRTLPVHLGAFVELKRVTSRNARIALSR